MSEKRNYSYTTKECEKLKTHDLKSIKTGEIIKLTGNVQLLEGKSGFVIETVSEVTEFYDGIGSGSHLGYPHSIAISTGSLNNGDYEFIPRKES